MIHYPLLLQKKNTPCFYILPMSLSKYIWCVPVFVCTYVYTGCIAYFRISSFGQQFLILNTYLVSLLFITQICHPGRSIDFCTLQIQIAVRAEYLLISDKIVLNCFLSSEVIVHRIVYGVYQPAV